MLQMVRLACLFPLPPFIHVVLSYPQPTFRVTAILPLESSLLPEVEPSCRHCPASQRRGKLGSGDGCFSLQGFLRPREAVTFCSLSTLADRPVGECHSWYERLYGVSWECRVSWESGVSTVCRVTQRGGVDVRIESWRQSAVGRLLYRS